MWKRTVLLFALLALALSACAAARSTPPEELALEVAPPDSYGQAYAAEESAKSVAGGAPAPMATAISQDNFAAGAEGAPRLVIKNAELQLVVQDPPAVMDAITALAEGMGGYVVSANLYQTTLEGGVKVPRASITIRVPAEKLNDALERIKSHSDQLPLREDISSQDVTSEYTDLNSRLRNLEAAEAQLQKIMEDAYKTEDVLRVYNQLTSVRQEIEVIKGRMQYLEQSAALSSISVELIADAAVQPVTIGGWEPTGVAKDAVRALISTYQNILEVIIWLVLYLVPVGVIVLLPPYFIIRGLLRWRRKRKAASQA